MRDFFNGSMLAVCFVLMGCGSDSGGSPAGATGGGGGLGGSPGPGAGAPGSGGVPGGGGITASSMGGMVQGTGGTPGGSGGVTSISTGGTSSVGTGGAAGGVSSNGGASGGGGAAATGGTMNGGAAGTSGSSGTSNGGAGGASGGSASLTGTLGALGPVQPIVNAWVISNSGETLIYLSTAPLTCMMMQTMGTPWLSKLPMGSQVVEIVVKGAPSAKTYQVGPFGGEVNYAPGGKSSSYETNASSGSITFTTAMANGPVEGSVMATYPMGSVMGTFHAEFCPMGSQY